MKIAILNNMAPFIRGGAELLAERLQLELELREHEVELVRIPFDWTSPQALLRSAAYAATMRLYGADRVIALKYPGYLIPHPEMHVWLVHPFRQIHDLWDTPHGWSSADREQLEARETILEMERVAFARARAVYAISDVVAGRARATLGLRPQPLFTPPYWTQPIEPGPFGDYVLALGRVGAAKRQELLVAAMALVEDPNLRLVIAGGPESEQTQHVLERRVAELGLGDRVSLELEFISEQRKRELLSGARAVAYLPIEEDSYGYVCLEGYQAGKPLITATDSGGTHQLVRDGQTGWIVAPDQESVAAALSQVAADPQRAERLGSAGRELSQTLGLNWDHVIEVLTS